MTETDITPKKRLTRKRHHRSLSTIAVMHRNTEYQDKSRDFTQAEISSHRETAELQKRLVAHNKSVNRSSKARISYVPTPETRELFLHIPPRKTRP